MAETMKAWQYAFPGPMESTLKLIENAPKPSSTIGPDDIFVQVIACGLNPADYKLQELGLLARAFTTFPKTTGIDLSGKVLHVGENVSHIKTGDLVVGRVDPLKAPGALAEYAVGPGKNFVVLPEGADAVKAAGLPTGALTAYQTIAPYVTPGKGDRIFINGGSGGTGSFGIQIAKNLGCHVTVTCSTNKVELCKELGADEVIDYKTTANVTQELKKRGHVFTLIVDNVGNSPADIFSSSRQYLEPAKPYIFVGGNLSLKTFGNILWSLVVPSSLGGVRGKFVTFLTKDTTDDMECIVNWFGEGKLRVIVESTLNLSEGKVAMQLVKAGSVAGKVIVTMNDQ